MEMESSRRPPFDRSRELNVKKPRLSSMSEKSVSSSMIGSGPNQFRASERERDSDDSVRGALQQYHQHQELVNQYKTALAELTFNSKPIITNLTIIAGENLQAAKAIASTICANILEVPTDQKLPSLYLLDSIVKNIGRDYINFFAARLPEVFCKAYRQVDPSVHPGMRHLFGTWKGVFPPQPLQIIEKELGFSAAVNGPSSRSTTSKSDSLTQRQPHSIHVNPKYLEARQRLQQPSKPKGTEIGVVDVGSSEDVERPERTAAAGTERPWADPSMKMQNIRPQREPLKESSLQKQGGVGYGEYELAPGLSRPVSTLVGKPSERVTGQRWLGAGREVEESMPSQRNGYDVKCGISNYTAARSAGGGIPLMQNSPRSSAEMSRSWKNSEEEEYMWDDLGTRVTVPGAVAATKKDFWSDDLEKLESGSQLPKWQSQTEVRSSFEREQSADTLSSEQKEQVPFGHPRSSESKMQESSVGVSSFGFPTTVSGSAGSMGQRRPSPGQSLIQQRPPSSLSKRDPRQNLVEKDHMRSYSLGQPDPRAASFSGQLNAGLRDRSFQSSLPSQLQNLQSGNEQKLQAQTPQKPPSPTLSFQQRHRVSSPEQVLGSSSLPRDASSECRNPSAGDPQGQTNVSSLLAAVMKSGLLSGSAVSGQVGIQSPATAPRDSVNPVSQKKVEKPPQVPGPLSSSSGISSTLAQTSNAASANSNPLSILSTLMAKGLISAPKTEAPAPVPIKSENQLQGQSPTVATTTVTVPSVSKTSVSPPAPTTEKISSSEPAGKRPDTSIQSPKAEVENLIGFEFRPPVLRELHPSVIDGLSNDLSLKCIACGLRFKQQERLARHSEWHAFKNSIPKCLNKPSRRWYIKSADWIAGEAGLPFGYQSGSLTEGSTWKGEENKNMVPADESNCVCFLCGELFEDFYCQERDEWMFRGAVYMSIPSGSTEKGPSSESGMQNVIVHADCKSDDSACELGLVSDIKVEKDT